MRAGIYRLLAGAIIAAIARPSVCNRRPGFGDPRRAQEGSASGVEIKFNGVNRGGREGGRRASRGMNAGQTGTRTRIWRGRACSSE